MNPTLVNWMSRYNAWLGFIDALTSTLKNAAGLPLGPTKYVMPVRKTQRLRGRQFTIFICSPHPDDEALVGALPLRALNETGARVVNCAITLGSDTKRRRERLAELKGSCAVLGFELKVPGSRQKPGLQNVKPDTAERDPQQWRVNRDLLRQTFEQITPDVVVMPHAGDFHGTHIGTHKLAKEVVIGYSNAKRGKRLLILQTEYWQPMKKPNLLVGLSPRDEATLVMAVAEHGSEVCRNPYHLRHPVRMMDNVRRGSEVVKGEGTPVEEFMFAELYQVSLMRNGVEKATSEWKVMPPNEPLNVEGLYALI